MFSGCLERNLIVVKICDQGIQPIMTIQADGAKGYRVRGQKERIHLSMAFLTDGQGKL